MSIALSRRHAAATLAALASLRPAAAQPVAAPEPEPQPETWSERPELSAAFTQAGTRGVFVVWDGPTQRWLTNDGARAFRRFTPASTFKIAGTVIGLDSGVVSGPDEVFRWDGVRRERPDWNRDHTLASAYQASAVWVFQTIARRVGPQGMQAWLHRLRYGSADAGAPAAHDRFWLQGPLAISAVEQVEFLRRLSQARLPIAARTQQMARTIMQREATPQYRLYAKTGWGNTHQGVARGWFVGWVERTGGGSSCFALNLDIMRDAHGEARVALARRLLDELGLLAGGTSK